MVRRINENIVEGDGAAGDCMVLSRSLCTLDIGRVSRYNPTRMSFAVHWYRERVRVRVVGEATSTHAHSTILNSLHALVFYHTYCLFLIIIQSFFFPHSSLVSEIHSR